MNQMLMAIANGLEQGKHEEDTLRFSQCAVPGRKGYRYGGVISTNPNVMQTLCAVWNNREEVAAALRASLNGDE